VAVWIADFAGCSFARSGPRDARTHACGEARLCLASIVGTCNDYLCNRKYMDYLCEVADISASRPSAVVAHRFKIGNMVDLTRNRSLGNAVGGPYEVLELLPERDGNFLERISESLATASKLISPATSRPKEK
jgi:hypothetical protein